MSTEIRTWMTLQRPRKLKAPVRSGLPSKKVVFGVPVVCSAFWLLNHIVIFPLALHRAIATIWVHSVLVFRPGGSLLLGKCSTTGPHSSRSVSIWFWGKVSLGCPGWLLNSPSECIIHPSPTSSWNYKHIPVGPASEMIWGRCSLKVCISALPSPGCPNDTAFTHLIHYTWECVDS